MFGTRGHVSEGQPFTLPSLGVPLVKKVNKVSDVEVADGIAIREIGPRVSAVEGQIAAEANLGYYFKGTTVII
ncbi:hypothetical protein Tco_0329782, partial [Tanacetum coccineum]